MYEYLINANGTYCSKNLEKVNATFFRGDTNAKMIMYN